jgi:hypothetical protein
MPFPAHPTVPLFLRDCMTSGVLMSVPSSSTHCSFSLFGTVCRSFVRAVAAHRTLLHSSIALSRCLDYPPWMCCADQTLQNCRDPLPPTRAFSSPPLFLSCNGRRQPSMEFNGRSSRLSLSERPSASSLAL